MTSSAIYASRFSLGRLFADFGRVLMRAGLPIVGSLVVFAVPLGIASTPWWRGGSDTPAATYQRIWGEVNIAKALIVLMTYSASAVFVAAASLTVLTAARWRDVFRPAPLAAGFATSLLLNLASNWPALVAPVAALLSAPIEQLRWVSLLTAPITLAVMAFAGIAVSAAIAEQLFVARAIGRSARLLRGLRWRVVGLGFVYLVTLELGEIGMAWALAGVGVSFAGSGLGLAALNLVGLAIGAGGDVAFVAFFVQARRIADGPTTQELHEVFA